MRLHLAGIKSYEKIISESDCKFVLESFAYITQKLFDGLDFEGFLLDSGAFTFLAQADNQINWTEYVERYAAFIVKNDIREFFELDIYKIIGTEKTEELRDYLEQLTGRQCMPVWHKHLGLEYLHKLSEEYSYIGFGGFVLRDIKLTEHKYIPALLDICRKNDCRVHGLGFTNMNSLEFCRFYSVDSTSWIGTRFGNIYFFKDRKMVYLRDPKRRAKKEATVHNLNEWVKFQHYAENNL